MEFIPFYKAIENVLIYGKVIRRNAWPEKYNILWLCTEMIKSSYILMNTGEEIIEYIPISEDMLASDWCEFREEKENN